MVDFTREDVIELIRKADPTLTLAVSDFEENAFIASTDSIFDYSVGGLY